ncbi:MAG: hypothetical protein CBD03_05055 [Rhizobiales bacterium TMED143]|nr:MAG: hypothetical protein CBD03_05055 [Rhizobiales bacterium TMED143]|tara:strand:+ start:2114 stop:2479 length:366 start_codon:yes stop_codon:yes gene_type:complete
MNEISISKEAAQVFINACEKEGMDMKETCLRVGADRKGCSGWKWTLDSEQTNDILITDEVQESNGITIISDRELLEDVLGPIAIDYTRVNLVEQGFTFKRPSGAVCGCGASFDAWKSELTV